MRWHVHAALPPRQSIFGSAAPFPREDIFLKIITAKPGGKPPRSFSLCVCVREFGISEGKGRRHHLFLLHSTTVTPQVSCGCSVTDSLNPARGCLCVSLLDLMRRAFKADPLAPPEAEAPPPPLHLWDHNNVLSYLDRMLISL